MTDVNPLQSIWAKQSILSPLKWYLLEETRKLEMNSDLPSPPPTLWWQCPLQLLLFEMPLRANPSHHSHNEGYINYFYVVVKIYLIEQLKGGSTDFGFHSITPGDMVAAAYGGWEHGIEAFHTKLYQGPEVGQ